MPSMERRLSSAGTRAVGIDPIVVTDDWPDPPPT